LAFWCIHWPSKGLYDNFSLFADSVGPDLVPAALYSDITIGHTNTH
jgi:hypothetical protein